MFYFTTESKMDQRYGHMLLRVLAINHCCIFQRSKETFCHWNVFHTVDKAFEKTFDWASFNSSKKKGFLTTSEIGMIMIPIYVNFPFWNIHEKLWEKILRDTSTHLIAKSIFQNLILVKNVFKTCLRCDNLILSACLQNV